MVRGGGVTRIFAASLGVAPEVQANRPVQPVVFLCSIAYHLRREYQHQNPSAPSQRQARQSAASDGA